MYTRDLQEVRKRLAEIEERLGIIEAAIDKEFERDFFSRRVDVFRFLEVEKKVYTAIFNELKWVIRE